MDFILATTNQGKIKEILDIFGANNKVRTLADINYPGEIIEDGKTFEENAIIKAKAVYNYVSDFDYIIADDSGLVIDALDGGPGVYSARWMGFDTPYEVRNQKLLEMLTNVPDEQRTARFVTIMACVWPDGRIETVSGTLEGIIAREAKGGKGFGYDPVFYLSVMGKHLGELERSEKNKISHRAVALRSLCKLLGVNLK